VLRGPDHDRKLAVQLMDNLGKVCRTSHEASH